MPLKTRAGSADAPIEPGARTLCEPWDLGPALKLWRLIVPWKPLPLRRPADLDRLADLEGVDGDGVADLQLVGLVAELDEVAVRADVGLLAGARARAVSAFSLHGAERELHGLVAVALVRADAR